MTNGLPMIRSVLAVAVLFAAVAGALVARPVSAQEAPSAAFRTVRACAAGVIDVRSDVKGNAVRFVLGGDGTGLTHADVELATTQTLYGVTIPSISLSYGSGVGGYAFSQQYSAVLPNSGRLTGVYLTSYVDTLGAKHECDPLGGLPPKALPYLPSLPHDRIAEGFFGSMPPAIAVSPIALMGLSGQYDCATPFRKAGIAHAASLDYPELAREEGAKGRVFLDVALAADGSVKGVSVASSSGDSMLDASAINAARQSTYAPAVSECKPISSTVPFRADFEQSR